MAKVKAASHAMVSLIEAREELDCKRACALREELVERLEEIKETKAVLEAMRTDTLALLTENGLCEYNEAVKLIG